MGDETHKSGFYPEEPVQMLGKNPGSSASRVCEFRMGSIHMTKYQINRDSSTTISEMCKQQQQSGKQCH